MSESKTPRTCEELKRFEKVTGISACSGLFCEKLELETAELKRQLDDASKALQDYNTLPCYDVAFDRGAMAAKQKYAAETTELKAKLAEYERQVKDGDMLTIDTFKAWLEVTHFYDCRSYGRLKQFSADRQKEGGV